MRKTTVIALLALALPACQSRETPAPAADAAAGTEKTAAPTPAPGTPEAKVASATAAAPVAISSAAAIMEWSGNPADQPTQLRAGTNGWTCYVDIPTTPDPDAMCLDKTSASWLQAYMEKKPPQVKAVGFAYMLSGDAGASLTDPFAQGPTADNQWIKMGPHVMVFVPDPKDLDAVTGTHASGEPYVMWKGTPYAHIMMPVPGNK